VAQQENSWTVGQVEPDGIRSHEAGVQAIVNIAESMGATDWTRPSGCKGWNGQDLAGHVLTVMRLWDHMLDRALDGDGSLEFPWDGFDAWNAQALCELPDRSGRGRVQEFASRSAAFYDRLAAAPPETVYGTPAATFLGHTVPLGEFAAYAALEWHVHAHDLAISAGVEYHPTDMVPINRAIHLWIASIPADHDVPWTSFVAGRPPA
jgi:uncharacterized protein (TIGR03083 family)